MAELVLELDEPFRTTVLLRYREGLSAEAIAEEQEIPAATVRGRLKTALDRLRDKLDEREHKKLHSLFAPLVPGVRPASTLWGIVMAKMTSKIGVAIVLALVVLVGALLLGQRSSPPKGVRQPDLVALAAKVPAGEVIARPALFVQSGVAARRVRGRVTSDSAPYGGAVVQLVHAETDVVLGEVRSAADGTFDLGDRPADLYAVTATAPARVAVPVVIDLRLPGTPAIELRLSACSHVRGTVVDGSGGPIDHARISRDDGPGVFVETDASGRYDLCVPFGSATISYVASGYHGVLVNLDVATTTTRNVVNTFPRRPSREPWSARTARRSRTRGSSSIPTRRWVPSATRGRLGSPRATEGSGSGASRRGATSSPALRGVCARRTSRS